MRSAPIPSAYWRGVRLSAPFIVAVVPFGMLFGVVATEAGLPMSQVMAMTVLVVAGASQFTALQLMTDGAPVFIVIASALAVNLRMAMYSAALAPYLGQAPRWQRLLVGYMNVDQTYALSEQEFQDRPGLSLRDRLAFFFGTATPTMSLWILASYVGAVVGDAIPPDIGLDFAVPITFLALTAPALRTRAHVVAAVTAVALAMAFAWMPWNLWLFIAGLGGMAAGAEAERRRDAESTP